MKALIIGTLIALSVAGCVTQPRNYKPAGFESSKEASEYVADYLYYASKLTSDEWSEFYSRFPEYWKDMQTAKSIGSTNDFHPWYTAYAFKWITNKKAATWGDETNERLREGLLARGDDIFKVVVGRGVPVRIIWDNDFEILLFRGNYAAIFQDSGYSEQKRCTGCATKQFEKQSGGLIIYPGGIEGITSKKVDGQGSVYVMKKNDVLRALRLTRRTY
jgi:hypothetical protein